MKPARKIQPGSIALSPRQLEVLKAVRALQKRNRVPPSRAEVAAHLGIRSENGIEVHLHVIASRGWLKIQPGTQRGLVLLREGAPLYEPEELQSTGEGEDEGELTTEAPEPTWIDCDLLWETFGAKPDACLRVRNDDMEGAGLVDGGIVALARKLDEAGSISIGDGNIVAARIEGEVVLRRVCAVDETTFELRAESRSRRHKAVRVGGETSDVEIIGVVIGRVLAGAG